MGYRQISYRHHGNHLVFERNAQKIKLLGLFDRAIWKTQHLQSGSLLQMQLMGDVRYPNTKPGGISSLTGERMELVSVLKDERCHGGLIVVIMKDPITNVLAEVNYWLCSQSPTIRTWVRVRNDSDTSVRIEFVYSTILYNLATGGVRPWYEKAYVHMWYSDWYEEWKWRRFKLEEMDPLHIPYPGLSRVIQHMCSGYDSKSETLPLGMLEDVETKTVWYWQIEHSPTWHWEIGEDESSQLYLMAGGPNGLHYDLWKELDPGESFRTVPVALGCVQGGYPEALAALELYYQNLISGAAAEPYCLVTSY